MCLKNNHILEQILSRWIYLCWSSFVQLCLSCQNAFEHETVDLQVTTLEVQETILTTLLEPWGFLDKSDQIYFSLLHLRIRGIMFHGIKVLSDFSTMSLLWSSHVYFLLWPGKITILGWHNFPHLQDLA